MGWTHKEYSCHGPQTIVQTLLHLGPKFKTKLDGLLNQRPL